MQMADSSPTGNPILSETLPLMLVVEDNISDQVLLQEAFRDHGVAIRFLVAETSGQALSALRLLSIKTLPRLILIDINIPTVSGHEILEVFQRDPQWASVPKVVWTSSETALDRERSMARGAVAHMVKPSDFDGYLALVPILKGLMSPPVPRPDVAP